MPHEIHRGLKIVPPPETVWTMGQGNARARFGAHVEELNPSGDWRKWMAKDEEQRKYGFEPFICGVFHIYRPWIMLAKFLGFTDFPLDLAERYGGVMCDVTPSGSDPVNNAEITRKKVGAIPQESMPWNEPDIDTWPEFYDRKAAYYNLDFGRKLIDRFDLGYEQIWDYNDRNKLTGKEKTDLIRTALKRGTVAVSVSVDYRTRRSAYYKNPGDSDTHFITITNLEKDGSRIMHDSYNPFIKRFEKDYDHEIGMVFFLKRKEEKTRNFWSIIWDNFAQLFKSRA